ncbi:hypothetical protein M9458_017173, partial [Cirrhinus mrigala]
LKLEAMEMQIHELLERQAELRERRATLESSWVPCTQDAIFSGVLHSGARTPQTLGAAAAEDASQAPGEDLTPSSASSLRDPHPERNAVNVGDSIVWYVRATLPKGKVHTHCFLGARVLNVSAQIPTILKDGKSVGMIVLHAGVNDTKLRQTEVLKRDFSSLIETIRSTSPATRIIVSAPLPT